MRITFPNLTSPTLRSSARRHAWIFAVTGVTLLTVIGLTQTLDAMPSVARWMPPAAVIAATGLAVGTLVSEDLALVAAGEAVRRQGIDLGPALIGCFLGIWIGDLGLWLIGRASVRRALGWQCLRRRIPPHKLTAFGEWFDRRSATAVFAARFVPGMRLPMFVAAGAAGRSGMRFAGWTLLAAIVWTPLIVVGVIVLGDLITAPLREVLGYTWLVVPVSIVLLYGAFRIAGRLSDPIGRARLVARVSRLWRWEFWPAWLFYLPVAAYIAAESLRRGGLSGFARITAANPGIPDGGFVGESKQQILAALPPKDVIPFFVAPTGSSAQRVLDEMTHRGWTFPVIVKPDVGQRGAGVRKCESAEAIADALRPLVFDAIVQRYHAGPHEVGIFYVRLPSDTKGRIFSITEKVFPAVVGDGRSTLSELVWRHARYRMQAYLLLSRHAVDADRVLPAGECFTLGVVGNHCQGTLFRDGSRLLTPAIEARIDQIARSFTGFNFGRFDIRYSDAKAFARGEDLAIVELNGVTSESTNVYDPAGTLIGAWLTFVRQWHWLFRIADANVALGHTPTPWRTLWRNIRRER